MKRRSSRPCEYSSPRWKMPSSAYVTRQHQSFVRRSAFGTSAPQRATTRQRPVVPPPIAIGGKHVTRRSRARGPNYIHHCDHQVYVSTSSASYHVALDTTQISGRRKFLSYRARRLHSSYRWRAQPSLLQESCCTPRDHPTWCSTFSRHKPSRLT